MNRRGFLKGVAVAVFCATTRIYALAAPAPVVEARNLTLAEWARQYDQDGPGEQIGKLLSEQNEILHDVIWRDKSDSGLVSSRLPEVAWK